MTNTEELIATLKKALSLHWDCTGFESSCMHCAVEKILEELEERNV